MKTIVNAECLYPMPGFSFSSGNFLRGGGGNPNPVFPCRRLYVGKYLLQQCPATLPEDFFRVLCVLKSCAYYDVTFVKSSKSHKPNSVIVFLLYSSNQQAISIFVPQRHDNCLNDFKKSFQSRCSAIVWGKDHGFSKWIQRVAHVHCFIQRYSLKLCFRSRKLIQRVAHTKHYVSEVANWFKESLMYTVSYKGIALKLCFRSSKLIQRVACSLYHTKL